MKIRNPRSLTIILVYIIANGFIIWSAYEQSADEMAANKKPGMIAPEYTEVEKLDYYHLKNGIPQMSLNAEKMRSLGQEMAEFEIPKGIYNYQEKNESMKYEAQKGVYKKAKELLTLEGKVRVTSAEAEYQADRVKYFFKKDLILGSGGVTFKGEDLKSKDQLHIQADSMRANPQGQFSRFSGNVKGRMERKKKYEGAMVFSSWQLELDGVKSLAQLEGNVDLKRDTYHITSGKADIYMENYNKSLKYFVLNDDVKVTETLQTPEGPTQRKAYAERLEGFGREEKMVLSGAPRVEQGKDVIKGYKITIRENMDLVEVDDSMSEVQVKKDEDKNKKKN